MFEPTGDEVPESAGQNESAQLEDDSGRCFGRMADQLSLDDTSNLRNITREEEVSATETVLREAGQGYDLLVLGASERGARPDDPLFSAEIDTIITQAPCPVMVVDSRQDAIEDDEPLQRILLPTAGTEYNRHAAEVAFAIARERDALVEIVHVVKPPERSARSFDQSTETRPLIQFGEEIVDGVAEVGDSMDTEVNTRVIVAENEPEEEIVRLARENGHDLVMLGSSLRPVSQRAFFGQRIEYVIKNSPCPVAVLSSR